MANLETTHATVILTVARARRLMAGSEKIRPVHVGLNSGNGIQWMFVSAELTEVDGKPMVQATFKKLVSPSLKGVQAGTTLEEAKAARTRKYNKRVANRSRCAKRKLPRYKKAVKHTAPSTEIVPLGTWEPLGAKTRRASAYNRAYRLWNMWKAVLGEIGLKPYRPWTGWGISLKQVPGLGLVIDEQDLVTARANHKQLARISKVVKLIEKNIDKLPNWMKGRFGLAKDGTFAEQYTVKYLEQLGCSAKATKRFGALDDAGIDILADTGKRTIKVQAKSSWYGLSRSLTHETTCRKYTYNVDLIVVGTERTNYAIKHQVQAQTGALVVSLFELRELDLNTVPNKKVNKRINKLIYKEA